MNAAIALALLIGPAADGITRLPPSSFKQLPAQVVEELTRRRCTIPQSYGTKGANNVISGEFARPGQTDWAVLCSKRGVSTIVVFWDGSAENPDTIAPGKDALYVVREFGTEKPAFTREIYSVGKKYIHAHSAAHGVPTLRKIDHKGINDAFLEKASEVYYFYRGKWLKLPGAD